MKSPKYEFANKVSSECHHQFWTQTPYADWGHYLNNESQHGVYIQIRDTLKEGMYAFSEERVEA